jgi:tRNA dimethylallyltransferase
MSESKPKIIVIMGPTACGKSDVAIKLAKKFDGEIISADSRQIFKDMNIGTGKVERDPIESKIQDTRYEIQKTFNIQILKSKTEDSKNTKYFYSEGIRHHLIDIARPGQDFNVSHFKTLAEKKIEEILSRKKIPIICGGTNFWIDAITKNTKLPNVLPNVKLRQELDKLSAERLFAKLAKLDPERARNIDAKNKVRLVRAIEICEAIGKVPITTQVTSNWKLVTKYEFLEIGLEVSREVLNEKIKKRLDERFESGMIAEVENLHKKKVSWKWMERIGLEYRWIARFLQKKVSKEEMSEKLYFDIIHYAKRQMTWLKRNSQIHWHSDYKSIEKEVEKFLRK